MRVPISASTGIRPTWSCTAAFRSGFERARLVRVRRWRRPTLGRMVRMCAKGESAMPGPLMIAISLALLAGSGHALAQTNPGTAAAAKADRPFNVGFVLYTRGKAPGTLDARWNYGNA